MLFTAGSVDSLLYTPANYHINPKVKSSELGQSLGCWEA
jgi:hypothetical protein